MFSYGKIDKFVPELLAKDRIRPRTFVLVSLVLELSLFGPVKSLTSTNESTTSVYSVFRLFKPDAYPFPRHRRQPSMCFSSSTGARARMSAEARSSRCSVAERSIDISSTTQAWGPSRRDDGKSSGVAPRVDFLRI
jgi:hypothetical protein